MGEKIIELIASIAKQIFDTPTRRKLCLTISLSCIILYMFIYHESECIAIGIIAGTLLIVDIIADFVSLKFGRWILRYRTTGEQARRRLDKLDLECKRIVRDIYKSKTQAVKLLDSNGAKTHLVECDIIYRCSSCAVLGLVDEYVFSYMLQPWVRRYIDDNKNWLSAFQSGRSTAYQDGLNYENSIL